jgi:hypothetical protein
MKNLILSILVLIGVSINLVAFEEHSKNDICDPLLIDCNSIFPWSEINGTWTGILDEQTLVFSFTSYKYKDELRLEIKQLDPVSSNVLATGIGVGSNGRIHAVMSNNAMSFKFTLNQNQEVTLGSIQLIVKMQRFDNELVNNFIIEKIRN